MKVYVIRRDNLSDFLKEKGVDENNVSDEVYKEACREWGWTMTLKEYEDAFNDENNLSVPRYDYDCIRFLE